MEPDYWLDRWRDGRIGFHREFVQPWLVIHARKLLPTGTERVLVPLCGKSFDLDWLERRGHAVVGVELAEAALREFLAEHHRAASESSHAEFRIFRSGRLEFWLGDFFALDPVRDGTFGAIHDRAALIALPPLQRGEYARHVVSLLAPTGRMLVVGLEYDVAVMEGPPFCVPRAEAERIYRSLGAACEFLGEKELIDEEPHFRAKGLTSAREYALLVTRPG